MQPLRHVAQARRLPQINENVGGEQHQRRVDRQHVTHIGGEAAALPEERDENPGDQEQKDDLFAAHNAPAGVEETGGRGDGQGDPHAPEEHVLQLEKPGHPPHPGPGRWVEPFAGLPVQHLGQVILPDTVDPEAERVESVRLGHTEDGEGGDSRQGQPDERLFESGRRWAGGRCRAVALRPELLDGRPGLDHRCHGDDDSQRYGADLARQGEAEHHPREGVVPAPPLLGRPHREVDAGQAEEGEVAVNDEEMGVLDLEDGDRQEEGGQEADTAAE